MATYTERLIMANQSELIAAQARGKSATNEFNSLVEDELREAKVRQIELEGKVGQNERMLRIEQFKNNELRTQNAKLQNESQQWREAIAERDAIILEWMQTNEAFKRLAKEYGKKAAIPEEQGQKDLDNHLLDIAEEDPEKFEKTNTTKKAKQRLGK